MTSATASKTDRVCALDGCETVVSTVPSGETRRYCCGAHRKLARKPLDPVHPVRRAPAEPTPEARRRAEPEAQPRRHRRRTTRSFAFQGARPGTTPTLPADPSAPGQPAPPAKPVPPTPAPEPAARPVASPVPVAPRPAAPSRPAPAAEPARPTPPAEPARPTPEAQPLRSPNSAEPARPGKSAEPARSGTARRPAAPRRKRPSLRGPSLEQFQETLRAALRSLASNRLRSVLTTAGIITGVASVILLVALGDGMTQQFNDQWSKLANQITVTPVTGSVATGKVPQRLTDDDVKALSNTEDAPHIATMSPAVVGTVALAVDQNKANSQLIGATENYLELVNRRLTAGSWLTQKQIDTSERVVILGPQVLSALWGSNTDPASLIGQPIRISHSTFKIQGVLATDGMNDNTAIVPLPSARAYLLGNNGGKLNQLIVKSTSVDTLYKAQSEIIDIMDRQHRVRTITDRDYNVTNYTNFLKQGNQSVKFMSMFIVAVAAISLFVGGVGVANIMLVSVTERTREIGIRKAIGAPRRAILRQFLSEAVLLTGLGGLVGVVLGIGLTKLGEVVIPSVWPADLSEGTSAAPVPILSASPVLIAFSVSLVIGLVAGGYPAHRAARMRPIEALRFE